MKKNVYYEKLNDPRCKKYKYFTKDMEISYSNEEPKKGMIEVIRKDSPQAVFYILEMINPDYGVIKGREHFTDNQLLKIANAITKR